MGLREVPVIEFDNVTVAFQNTVALSDVSFALGKGEFLGIIGPNGSGKTTLLKTVLGLVKPVQGTVRVLGQSGAGISRIRRRIGYVPQRKPIDPKFPVSVRDAVLMGTYAVLGFLQSPGVKERKRVRVVLEAVGLDEFAGHIAGHLSGGQQQRLFLARALVAEPEILLLDEPTAGVDVVTRSSIVELIRSLHKSWHLTTLYVTHDVNEVMDCTDKVLLLNRTVQAYGRCNEVINEAMLARLYGSGVRVLERAGRRYVVAGDYHA